MATAKTSMEPFLLLPFLLTKASHNYCCWYFTILMIECFLLSIFFSPENREELISPDSNGLSETLLRADNLFTQGNRITEAKFRFAKDVAASHKICREQVINVMCRGQAI